MDKMMTISLSNLIELIGVLITLLGAVIWQFVWVKSKIAELFVKVTDIEERLERSYKYTERDQLVIAREIKELGDQMTSGFNKIETNFKEMRSDIKQVEIRCAKHFPED